MFTPRKGFSTITSYSTVAFSSVAQQRAIDNLDVAQDIVINTIFTRTTSTM